MSPTGHPGTVKRGVLAPALMVQGTASSVGKSVLVTALCRLFHRQGVRVAPFKAQNMALNAFVTADGKEIGRAQAVQAEAAGLSPAVEMNPILLKPEGNLRSQVVVLGKALGSMKFGEYHDHQAELRAVIAESLRRLRASYELVIIEGAGSPAEVNLRSRDLVNMHVARLASAPVILLGDIDRGGVFAQFVGTMALLEPSERARVAALAINKFRGELALLQPGLDFVTRRLKRPMLGVIPYIERLCIAEEDSAGLEQRPRRRTGDATGLDIAVVRLPGISNYDDFQPLEHEPGVVVRYAEQPAELTGAALVIVPGSKTTAADLGWLRGTGFAAALVERARRGEPVLGICGGCQMLGESIQDPHQVESPARATAGLGLLKIETRFRRRKLTAQVRAQAEGSSFLTEGVGSRRELSAYEIHMGIVERGRSVAAPFRIRSRNGARASVLDGALSDDRVVVGTMLHGLFENDAIRDAMLRSLRRRSGLAKPVGAAPVPAREAEYDRLAATVREHVDVALLQRLVGLGR